jgi:TolB protein
MIRQTVAAVAATATVVASVVATVAHATAPGANGRIAFMRYRLYDGAPSDIWVANANGTSEHRVTRAPKRYEDDQPDWSPDGTRLVFTRCPMSDVNGRCHVFAVGASGTKLTRLGPSCNGPPPGCEDRLGASWSPDGRSIAFSREWGPVRSNQIEFSDIYVADASGRHPRRITHFTSAKPYSLDVGTTMWSPDGRRIAFEVQNAAHTKPVNRRAIYVVNRDGSGLRQLTPWKLDAGDQPDWSPDGTRILFRSISTGDFTRGDLYSIAPDGTGLHRVTHFGTIPRVLSGSYSPDGRQILFATTSGATDPSRGLPDLFEMRTDGTHIRQVTHSENWDGWPDWGPR